MKAMAINGSPRKGWNTEQLLRKALEGAESAGAEAEVIQLYEEPFKGCVSCFACKIKNSKTNGLCAYRDALTPILAKVQEADVIIVGSPVYYDCPTAQTRAFLERLLYPGCSDKPTPSIFLYSINATEELKDKFEFEGALCTSRKFMESNFQYKPECVYSFDTYQYNDNEMLNEEFRQNNAHKLERQKVQFPIDLANAHDAGVRMVKHINSLDNSSPL